MRTPSVVATTGTGYDARISLTLYSVAKTGQWTDLDHELSERVLAHS